MPILRLSEAVDDHCPVAVVDFDGVIAQYDGWLGDDIFGDAMPGAAEALTELRTHGWQIIIWTTRQVTPGLKNYLKNNYIPYDSINTTDHNPPGTSNKPIADVYIDDRSWYDVGREFSWDLVMNRLRTVFLDEDL